MRNSRGHFVKGNTEGFTTSRKQALTAQVTIRLTPQVKDRLKNIPNWQHQVREYIEAIAMKSHGH